MQKPPAYQWYVRQWLSSPTRLSMTKSERSAYRDLLDHCWECGGSLPNDHDLLRRMADCTKAEWRRFGEKILSHFFKLPDGRLTNALIKELWEERAAFIENRSVSGKHGAAKRWHSHDSAIAQPMAVDSSVSASVSVTGSNGVGAALSESERRAERAHELQMEVQKTAQVKAEAEILGRTERLSGRRDAQAGANPNNAGLPPISREKWEEWDRTMAERRAKKAQ